MPTVSLKNNKHAPIVYMEFLEEEDSAAVEQELISFLPKLQSCKVYCYGANSQSQNQSTLNTRNTFNATASAPTNSTNTMRAKKVDREPPQTSNAALIAKQARRIPLHKVHNIRSKIISFKIYTFLFIFKFLILSKY